MGSTCTWTDASASTPNILGTALNYRSPVILSISWLGINVAEAQSMLSDLACTLFTIPMLPSPSHLGRGAALFSELLYVNGCIRPVHNLLRYRQPLLWWHEIHKGQPYDSLGEGVTIPFGKPDFLSLKPYLVFAGAQNQRDSGRNRTIAAEFPSNYRAYRKVDFLCVCGHFCFPLLWTVNPSCSKHAVVEIRTTIKNLNRLVMLPPAEIVLCRVVHWPKSVTIDQNTSRTNNSIQPNRGISTCGATPRQIHWRLVDFVTPDPPNNIVRCKGLAHFWATMTE
jgi:hypothetical protein